ncbi:hypothetical protein [Methylomagnum ishizawai]|uniref:hypothetical protein n=1 Tax=Methylomagnum ishizawai TaxID=1760988 RepID=UPI001C31EE67|nr:hypothetical protein [Methylomagnum ishizawai]BBL77535.1 hypothetical protein MishRS11D_46330 [Methylomagnum ishizawai]
MEKNFDALLKKWLHHDRLLNDRERYYLVLQAGVFAILSYLFAGNKDDAVIVIIIAPVLLMAIWVIFVYYKTSQQIDYLYRNAFDKEIFNHIINLISDGNDKDKDKDKGIEKNEPLYYKWATRFEPIAEKYNGYTIDLSIFKKLEEKIENNFFGAKINFKYDENNNLDIMEYRIKLMRGIAVIETLVIVIATLIKIFI